MARQRLPTGASTNPEPSIITPGQSVEAVPAFRFLYHTCFDYGGVTVNVAVFVTPFRVAESVTTVGEVTGVVVT